MYNVIYSDYNYFPFWNYDYNCDYWLSLPYAWDVHYAKPDHKNKQVQTEGHSGNQITMHKHIHDPKKSQTVLKTCHHYAW